MIWILNLCFRIIFFAYLDGYLIIEQLEIYILEEVFYLQVRLNCAYSHRGNLKSDLIIGILNLGDGLAALMIGASTRGQVQDQSQIEDCDACVNQLISESEGGSINFYVHLSYEVAIERSVLTEIAINRSENDCLLHKKQAIFGGNEMEKDY